VTYFPLLLSLAHFGSRLPPRRPDRRSGPSGKVGTIPRAATCVCPACEKSLLTIGGPIRPTYNTKGQKRLTRAQRKACKGRGSR
jgi:hypothetical protein